MYVSEILQISYNKKMMKYCGEEDSGNHTHPGNSSIFIPATKVKLSLLTKEVDQGPTPPVGFSAFYQATGDKWNILHATVGTNIMDILYPKYVP